jgi:hypothetical protein
MGGVVTMHEYSSDAPDRKYAKWIIAGLAIAAAYFYGITSSYFSFALPWWVESPSIMLIYGFIHYFYNRKMWKNDILGFRLSRMPNCSGTWFGELESTFQKGVKTYGMLQIHQTWSRISVYFKNDTSESFSRMASLSITPGPSQGLIYEYANEPRANAQEAMHSHRGFAFLKLSPDSEWLDGDYYTGRDRGNQGTMRFRIVSRTEIDFRQALETYKKMKG